MSRKSLVALAITQIGTEEHPPNSNKNKYGEWYGFNGYAWCAMFVSWVYDKAGYPLGKIDDIKGFRGCQSGYNHWRSTGELTTSPQEGDIVLYDWNGDRYCDHTGIFKEWIIKGKTFKAIEGNTATGNDSNGGRVMERKRNVQSVRAFVCPKVLGANPSVADDFYNWKNGDRGSEITYVQKLLYDLKYKIVVDGYYGPKTKATIKQFQKDNDLPVDGKMSASITGIMQQLLQKQEAARTKLVTGTYLKKRAIGHPVLVLQKALNKKSGKKVVIEDGVFGKELYGALKVFQKANKLTVDGIAGPETFSALGIKNI